MFKCRVPMWFGSIIIAIDARNSYMIAVHRARTRITGFTWLWSNFADKRRSWQHVQLDLLYTIDRPWLILHAELSSRCPERVSIFILDSRLSPPSRRLSLYSLLSSLPLIH